VVTFVTGIFEHTQLLSREAMPKRLSGQSSRSRIARASRRLAASIILP
jgi:hypothetical protein